MDYLARKSLGRALGPKADAVQMMAAADSNIEVLRINVATRDLWNTLTDLVANDPRWEISVWSTGDPYLQFTGSGPDFFTGSITLAAENKPGAYTVSADVRLSEVRDMLHKLRKRLQAPI